MQDQYDPFLKAYVRTIEHPKQDMVFVLFDSGYENIFFRDVESGCWIEQDLGNTDLANQVGESRKNFLGNPDRQLELKWLHIKTCKHTYGFGFFKYPTREGYAFDIYYSNRRFMFTVSKSDDEVWYAIQYGGEADWDFRPGWISELPRILEPYLDSP
jgi:hypothetical protein